MIFITFQFIQGKTLSLLCSLSRYLQDFRTKGQQDSNNPSNSKPSSEHPANTQSELDEFEFWAKMRRMKQEEMKKRRILGSRQRNLNKDRHNMFDDLESDGISDDYSSFEDIIDDEDEDENQNDPWQRPEKQVFFFSRTHTQIKQLVSEFNKIPNSFSISILASRQRLCIHPELRGKSVFFSFFYCFILFSLYF